MKRMSKMVFAATAVVWVASMIPNCLSAADKPAPPAATPAAADKPAAPPAAPAADKTAAPADRVVVMYFHRTKRCPTCLKMGSYSEEAVREKFAEPLKKGKVEFQFIDFQDEKNEALAKGYKVSGPTLIVAKISGKKVKEYKALKDIWSKNGDKAEFFKYVQENITAYAK